jgi:Tfp pilus assembly protein PilN
MSWDSPWAERRLHGARVNLLPAAVRERRLVQRQRAGMGAAAAILLVVLGLWLAVETRALADAREDADREQQSAAALRARRLQLQPIADLETQIAAAEKLRADVYSREIRFSGVMRDLSAIVPDDVWLTQMSATFTNATAATGAGGPAPAGGSTPAGGQPAAATTPGSPGAGSPVASLTLTGAGLGHVDVGDFMRTLASGPSKDGQRVYMNPYFTTSQRGESAQTATVTFSASVDLSQAAFSRRFQADAQTGAPTP